MKVELLPGWGIDASALAPLQQALQSLLPDANINVHTLPLWRSNQLEEALTLTEQTLAEDSWLVGWSLGGMLAMQLAARQAKRYKGIISLASNASFIAQDTWPYAMPSTVFEAFLTGCKEQLSSTLKRFVMLCAQGSKDIKAVRKQLQTIQDLSAEQATFGLEILAQLNNQPVLHCSIPQLHLLATDDALVPASAIKPMSQITHCISLQGGHAFVLEQATFCAEKISELMQAHP
ncbi:alpha/beta fold hydrolase [Pseudomonas sp. F1_0610]|uniref:alpha/beta fold hydrolase n=1 Tax=Pseudomonas sp. F1_0610 TaxID=3114284 RepID=UPI0039C339F5